MKKIAAIALVLVAIFLAVQTAHTISHIDEPDLWFNQLSEWADLQLYHAIEYVAGDCAYHRYYIWRLGPEKLKKEHEAALAARERPPFL